MSDKPLDAERKAIKKAARAAESLAEALKAVGAAAPALEERAFEALPAISDAQKACGQLRELPQTLDAVQRGLDSLQQQAETAAERSKARLVGGLADALQAQGITLSGRLPTLKCGPLTLELSGGQKPEVVVYYGPKIETLGRAPVDPEAVVKAVQAALAEVEPEPLDEAAFLDELQTAWRVALAREGLSAGDKAPIIAVLAELAAGRQSDSWRQDPSKQRYRGYSRVQFSHDLARLRTRARDGRELVLTVATRDQTKKAGDHLWVDGTHYAFLSFRGR